MTKAEALGILQLPRNYDKEWLRLNYHKFFVDEFRLKSAALTNSEVSQHESILNLLNKAFSLLDGTEIVENDELQLDFRLKEIDKSKLQNLKKKPETAFVSFIEKMMREHREGLSLSLLEISIGLSLKESHGFSPVNLNVLMPLLGQLLIELGMVNQGIKYFNFGKGNYEKGLAFKHIGDYKMAAHHFALELPLNESNVPVDEICQHISICYFLLNDYENAIDIIETVLPRLATKKNIFEESCKWKNFATAIMVSMNKLNKFAGKTFDGIKLRLKYPLCFKYLQKCYGNIDAAWNVIESFESNSSKYDEFLNNLKTKPNFRNNINMDYDLEEISECYSSIFNQPLNKSLIYNPK